jgi:hypothetical protein
MLFLTYDERKVENKMATITKEQVKAQLLLACTVIEKVRNAGSLGEPSGHIYMFICELAPQTTLDGYYDFMQSLVNTGLIKKKGDCYHPTAKLLSAPQVAQ